MCITTDSQASSSQTLATTCGWATSEETLTAESTQFSILPERSSGSSPLTRWVNKTFQPWSITCCMWQGRRSSRTSATRWAPWPFGLWWTPDLGWTLRCNWKDWKMCEEKNQVRLMIGLAPVTAAALHPASPLNPLATFSQGVSKNHFSRSESKRFFPVSE